ncbi:MAG TPA: C45 family autoproteolytic acyltransferase/hydrolase [Bryobacteraceae bacterium]|nr:C45 family autoproteolytic acyltransferase/hydrolase [Bryobacteraceae bacterium]
MRQLVCFLFVACTAHAATAVYKSSFEDSNSGWTAVHGTAVTDAAVTRANNKSLRLEAGNNSSDAIARSVPISLKLGRLYELSGWARTANLTVRDTDRSPIAVGASLSMASMPFDVHSMSVGGTHDWTRLTLRFVASRSEDAIVLTAGSGGALSGRAWFQGVSLDEVSSQDEWPSREAVQTFGPAYRYPAAGWIYLHIEGKPYDRGYQHGYLMAREIPEYLTRCAFDLGGKADAQSWDQFRTAANALFLRGFDREILEEMRGIADGANANGAKWLGRKLDLIDILVANTDVEMGELRWALDMTPTGLEGLRFDLPGYARAKRGSVIDHCSAFAATGPATRDGKMIVGHVTWWPQTLAEQTNVMLDIKPETGHRMLMQSYPGGIESGTDWYQNDAGMVLTETTIEQTSFHIEGTPVALRARRAIQYGGNIDEVVRELGTRNNGLYTNEWLIGDGKNNEIAMYELGTNHTRLWRSSKNDWFGGTPGFYWGDNNSKDLTVNLEQAPDPQGAPLYLPYVPAVRDLAWQDLYRKYKGQIDEQFAFLAFRSAPLVAASTMDAKVATAEMANGLMVWAEIGRPNQSAWIAPPNNQGPNHGLFPGGYHLFSGQAPETLLSMVHEKEKSRLATKSEDFTPAAKPAPDYADRLWKGWILPASDADTWLVAGSAAYYQWLQSKDLEKTLEAQRIRYRGLRLVADNEQTHFRREQIKGALFLDQLRRKKGNDAFFKLMEDYYAANTTKRVTGRSFLDQAGVAFEVPAEGEGPAYLPGDIRRRLAAATIVYGTAAEAGTNRYAAERLQTQYRDWEQVNVAISKDFEVSDDELRHRDVIFVGRPETNSALAAWAAKLQLKYEGAVLRLDGETYASERNSLVMAAANPLDASHMVLVFAGNGPLGTVQALNADYAETPATVLEDGKPLTLTSGAK